MRQVLFYIPLPFGDARMPIFGFGVMLIIAFVASAWLAGRRAKREGYFSTIPWDVGLYIFVGGVIGARLLSMFVDQKPPINLWEGIQQFVKIWEGGLVLYGAIPGGLLGYLLAYRYVAKPAKVRTLQIADWLAPSIALGIAFGRIGCFLNGCCYGDVADPAHVPSSMTVQFPANSNPYHEVVWLRGWQTTFGMQLGMDIKDDCTIVAVDFGSSAEKAGLQKDDLVESINGHATLTRDAINQALIAVRPYEEVTITVKRHGETKNLTFVPPPSLPLLPTQLYMALDGIILCLLLSAYYPLRRREGAVIALLMMTYSINRYLIEQLRLDNPEYVGNFTISQTISIGLFAAGMAMMILVQWKGRPVRGGAIPEVATSVVR
ncbi:MAG TPA: prolipoprotein diacylglyceryl transferase [Gemmatales bacterium]|nr:prolipoprotein diacylglyceryl transferase [Gemmatales bacterium]